MKTSTPESMGKVAEKIYSRFGFWSLFEAARSQLHRVYNDLFFLLEMLARNETDSAFENHFESLESLVFSLSVHVLTL
jgi:hypothetical protein